MTTDRITQSKARVEAATEGPWFAELRPDGVVGAEVHNAALTLAVTGQTLGDAQELADAEFIAHAREDVPFLIAEVERLTGYLEIVDAMYLGMVAQRDAATERESARWVEALTSDEVARVAAVASNRVLCGPGHFGNLPASEQRYEQEAATAALRAAADTIRGGNA